MSYRGLLSLALLCASTLRPVAGACYYRNGTEGNSNYSPCSSDPLDPLYNVCCADRDICLPNGLCQFEQTIWREKCTKQNWSEGGCQELCSTERDSQKNMDVVVTPCGGNVTSTEWCCSASDACCSPGSDLPKYIIARKFGDPIPSPSASLASSTSSSSSTPSVTSSGTSSPPAGSAQATPSGLSTGAKAGIGVGVAAGIIALVTLGIFAWKAMQWRKTAKAVTLVHEMPERYAQSDIYRHEQSPYEHDKEGAAQLAGAESQVHEMSDVHSISEAYVSSPRP